MKNQQTLGHKYKLFNYSAPYCIAYAYRLCLFIVGEWSERNTAYGKSDGTILIEA